MQRLIRRAYKWAYGSGGTFVRRWRSRRMLEMFDCIKPKSGARVIDLGGDEFMWTLVPNTFHVTLVNLPGRTHPLIDPNRFALVEADATDLRDRFGDNSFDLAFCNSVIEHVGDESRQEALASEMRRLAPAYWIQTPSDRFPLEPHTGIPFYWRLPGSLIEWMNTRWERDMPDLWQMVRGTRVLTRERMQQLFPDGQVYVERILGLEKSYALYRVSP